MGEVAGMTGPAHPTGPVPLAQSFWRHRSLIGQMIARDVVGRYRGSLLGLLWSFFHPILMLAVYTVVFGGIFKSRWTEGSGAPGEVALILFAGMIVHGVFAEGINRAPDLIIQNVNLVKKVVFPLEILPLVSMGSTLFHAAMSSLVLLTFFAAVNGHIVWTAALFPLVLLPLIVLALGASWFLSSLGVFLRDIGQATGIVTTVLMFLSPVFYPSSALAEPYRSLLHLNPLTFAIEQSRNVLLFGKLPDWQGLVLFLAIAIACAWLGLVWFQKTRKGFADVL